MCEFESLELCQEVNLPLNSVETANHTPLTCWSHPLTWNLYSLRVLVGLEAAEPGRVVFEQPLASGVGETRSHLAHQVVHGTPEVPRSHAWQLAAFLPKPLLYEVPILLRTRMKQRQ